MVHLQGNIKIIKTMTPQEFFKNDLFAENAGVVLLEVREGYSKGRGCSRYGQHIRQMYFPALQLLHRLSGFRDLLSI